MSLDDNIQSESPGMLTGVYDNFERSDGDGGSASRHISSAQNLFGLWVWEPVDSVHVDFDGSRRLTVDLRYEGESVNRQALMGAVRGGWFEVTDSYSAAATDGVSASGIRVSRFRRVGAYLVMESRGRTRGFAWLLPYLSIDRRWQRARTTE